MKFVKTSFPNPESMIEMPLMDTSLITRKWIDIEYTPAAPHPSRKLDIYLPEEGSGPFPTIICMHGGAFTGGAKNDFQVSGYVEGVAHGFAVVSVEQRLCTLLPEGGYSKEGRFPNPLHDYKAAIRFLKANAQQYMLNPNRFAAAGDSAGGWHAIMAAATANVSAMYDDSLGWADIDDSVHAVVDWFGCGDLLTESIFNAASETMTLPNGMVIPRVVFEDVFLGLKCVDYPQLARFASPEAWITSKMPPVLLQHGEADEIVTVECSRRIAKLMVGVCGEDSVDYDEFPGYTHGDERFYSDENLKRVFSWLSVKLV